MTQTHGRLPKGILVSDFDGTMTRHDFYKLAVESLLPPDTPDYWADYRAGTTTHFEALQRYFASIRVSEADVRAVVKRMELDPGLPAAITELRRAGWDVVVTSAGCDWYIHQLLANAGVDLIVHANPGRFVAGHGLLMDHPTNSPFRSEQFGIDKARVVRHYLNEGRKVAFAGDGFPDVESARLVSTKNRFARGDLATVLSQEHLEYQSFVNWSDVARMILAGSLT